jgi:hypothetical protein
MTESSVYLFCIFYQFWCRPIAELTSWGEKAVCGLITTYYIRASGFILPRDECIAPRLMLFEFQNWKPRQICTLILEFVVPNVNEYTTEHFTWYVNSF